ncbi:hydrolase [Geminicoccus harenae]|uniref:hydrolase n=1 Tax=Geminicoccus harenae TaxID=2498453 RepID=UPI00168C01D1|nr:hydrolase [Geminicoccus harenae]
MLLSAHSSALLLVDLQDRLLPTVLEQDELIERCRLMLHAARRLDVPVLVTEQYPKGLGPTVAAVAELLRPDEVIAKIAFSAMGDPHVVERIGMLGRETLVVAGAESHVCVLQTVLDLIGRGRKVAVVADAVGSRRAFDKETALVRMRRAGAQVVTADMVVFEWLERAGTDDFKALVPLLRGR